MLAKRRMMVGLLGSLAPLAVLAEVPDADAATAHAEPELPEKVDRNLPLDAGVSIIQRRGAVIEEYRRGGVVYMIKVTPKHGRPYFLIDANGDGRVDRYSAYEGPAQAVLWTVLEW